MKGADSSFLVRQRVYSVDIHRNRPEKAGTVMYDEDDHFEAAIRLAEEDPVRGAEALRSVVANDAFDPDTRFEAAAMLAEVDETLAAEALRGIVADDAFDPDIRSEAAARLGEIGRVQVTVPTLGFGSPVPQSPPPPRAPRAPQAPRPPRAPQAPRR